MIKIITSDFDKIHVYSGLCDSIMILSRFAVLP